MHSVHCTNNSVNNGTHSVTFLSTNVLERPMDAFSGHYLKIEAFFLLIYLFATCFRLSQHVVLRLR